MDQPHGDAPPPVTAVLEQGERVLWSGRPAPRPYVVGGLVVTVPLGLIAVGSAVTWTQGVDRLPGWAVGVLALVLIFAVHMLVLRPLLSLYLARRLYYAITDRRALVVCDGWGGRLYQLAHDQGAPVAIKGPGNSGKIKLGPAESSSMDVLLLGRAAVPGFYGLGDVDEPLAVLLRQRSSSGTRGAQPA